MKECTSCRLALNRNLVESSVTLRGRYELEARDPHTGSIAPIEAQYVTRNATDFTEVRLKLPYLKSVFLMSKTN